MLMVIVNIKTCEMPHCVRYAFMSTFRFGIVFLKWKKVIISRKHKISVVEMDHYNGDDYNASSFK